MYDTIPEALQQRIIAWYKSEILPRSHADGTYEKLQEEIEELNAAMWEYLQAVTYLGPGDAEEAAVISNARQRVREEAADVAIVLLCWAHAESIDLGDAVANKHRVNEGRQWGPPNAAGVRRHI